MTTACLFVENPVTELDEQLILDPVTRSLVIMDVGHHITHRGSRFSHSGQVSVAAAGTFVHLFVVPVGVYPHLQAFSVDSSTAPILSQLYESPTVTNNGSLQVVINHNRVSSKTAAMQVYHQPTVTIDGTHLQTKQLTGNKQEGGTFSTGENEFIFKPNTLYLHRITNNGNQTASITYDAGWYELPL